MNHDYKFLMVEGSKPSIYSTTSLGAENKINETGKYTKEKFYGACVDTGSSKSVCGYNQIVAYQKKSPHAPKLRPSAVSFRIGNHVCPNKRLLSFRIPIIKCIFVSINADIIIAHVPHLIGLQDLRRHNLLLNYLNNVLTHKPSGTELSVGAAESSLFLQ